MMPHLGSRSIYDPCFQWTGPSFGGFKLQNRGQTGSRSIYVYIYIYIRIWKLPLF